MTHEQEMGWAALCLRLRQDEARGLTKGKITMHQNMRAGVLAMAARVPGMEREIEAQRRRIAELTAKLQGSLG